MGVTLNKSIRLDHLNRVELQDWAFLPNQITAHLESQGMRTDSGESMVFALQLQHMRAQLLDRDYPELKARRLIPQQKESAPGDTEFAFIVADKVGMFDLIVNYADDLPLTDVKGEKYVVDINSFGGAFQYTIDDVEKASKAGVQLSSRKAASNREAAEQKFERIAWLGDEKSGALGMLTVPNATKETSSSKADGGTTWLNNATAQEVYNDLARPQLQQIQDTKGIERPNVYVLTPQDLEYARNVTFDNNVNGESAMQRFQKRYPNVTIEDSVYMEASGAAGTNVLLAYRNDPMKVAMETPLPYNVMAPQFRNLATIINARMRTAGVVAYKPLSITIIEGL